MKTKVIEVTSTDDLPERYILFPDDLEAALVRLDQITDKLHKRGIRVADPLVAFRLTVKENTFNKGKETVTKPRTPYAQLAFRIEKI